jgi:hypothetical protein
MHDTLRILSVELMTGTRSLDVMSASESSNCLKAWYTLLYLHVDKYVPLATESWNKSWCSSQETKPTDCKIMLGHFVEIGFDNYCTGRQTLEREIRLTRVFIVTHPCLCTPTVIFLKERHAQGILTTMTFHPSPF